MNRYVAAATGQLGKGLNRAMRTLFPAAHARRREADFKVHAAVWNNDTLRILNKIIADSGVYVRSGPFKGMMYWPVAYPGYWSGGLTPSLLGVYERELHEPLIEFVKRGPAHIINIGSAEGYYSVGLALQAPAAHVFAFDIDTKFQHLCKASALVNGVADRVTVDGECTVERLQQLTQRRALVLCDIEGGEVQLLRPDLAPALAGADILVELHDIFQPGTTEAILPRFQATHDIRIVRTEPRDPAELSQLDFLTSDERRQALDERRPAPMQWAIMKARSRPS
jgi:hypothetical protein